MATFSEIAGAEPSTVTFKVRTAVLDVNGTNLQQEILVIGDAESTLAVARVLNQAPASTDWGVVTRLAGTATIQGNSTAVQGTNPWIIAGNSTVVFAAGHVSSAAPAGNSSGVVVRIAGGPSSAVDLVMRPVFSGTAADNPVQISGNSTVVLSALAAGLQSSAAAAANSSALLVRVVGGASSAADFPVSISGNSTTVISAFAAALISSAAPAGNSSALLVRVAGGASSAADFKVQTTPVSTAWVKNAGFAVDSSNHLQVVASFTGSTGPLTVSQLLDSSGGSITAGDSANQAVRVNVVAGATSGPTSTAAPAANDTGLVVRQVGYSTVVSVAALPAGSTSVTIAAITGPVSTAAPGTGDTGLVVRQVGYSTVVSVAAMPANSSLVSVTAFPAAMVSTLAVAPGSSALLVREVVSSLNSTSVVITSSNSTALYAVVSSQATAQRVHAYFIGLSTSGNLSTVIFMSGSTNHVWGVVASSGYWAANLSVNPPAELFRANAGEPLNVVIQSASTGNTARISVSWRQDA